MGRKKSGNGPIASNKKRPRKFPKEVASIFKKAYELSTLCDIQVCVIIFGSKGEPPCVWPGDSDKLNNILTRYRNIPLEERRKRSLDLSSVPKKSKTEQVLDTRNDMPVDNLPKMGFPWDDRINNFSGEQLIGLANHLHSKIEIVKGRIEVMKYMCRCSSKLENVHYCPNPLVKFNSCGEEQKMTRELETMPRMQYQCQSFNVVDNYHRCLEDPRMVTGMTTPMEMTNNGGFYFNNNNTNGNAVDHKNGFMGPNSFNNNNNINNSNNCNAGAHNEFMGPNSFNYNNINNYNNNNNNSINNSNVGDFKGGPTTWDLSPLGNLTMRDPQPQHQVQAQQFNSGHQLFY